MWHAWGRGEKCRVFWWESPKEKANCKARAQMEGLDQNGL
jgi:hypothetical protein